MTAVGFEPTQLALVELEFTPLDHSGKLSMVSARCGSPNVKHCLGGCRPSLLVCANIAYS